MRVKTALYPALLLVFVLLCSGGEAVPAAAGAFAEGTAAQTATPAASAPARMPSPSPTPSPSLTPSPSPSPTAAPTSSPTPTPDPWAGFFSDTPVIRMTNAYTKKGTYLYTDRNLSVSIKVLYRYGGLENYVAEIYTRGLLFANGFADPKKPRTTRKPWQIARTHKAILAFNADYWNHNTLTAGVTRQKGIILRNGKVMSQSKAGETLAFMPDGDLRVFEKGTVTAKQLLDMGVKDTIWFGPVLVKDGKINPNMKKHIVYRTLNKPNGRCSIGIVEPGHYFIVVSRNITLDQLARLHVELGSKLAYNLDGGQSTAIVFMGNQINGQVNPTRSLPELFFIGTSDKVPGVKDRVYGAPNTR